MFASFARVAVVLALTTPGPSAAPAQPGAPASKPALAQLAWIAGHWVDESDGTLSEEIWTAPSGDSMIGMWRYVGKGKLQIFEILSITDEAGGPVFRLRHFDPRMVARARRRTSRSPWRSCPSRTARPRSRGRASRRERCASPTGDWPPIE